MQRLAILVILAALTAACGKKQPPAAPKAPTETKDEAKPGDGSGTESTPTMRRTDPCEGGEGK